MCLLISGSKVRVLARPLTLRRPGVHRASKVSFASLPAAGYFRAQTGARLCSPPDKRVPMLRCRPARQPTWRDASDLVRRPRTARARVRSILRTGTGHAQRAAPPAMGTQPVAYCTRKTAYCGGSRLTDTRASMEFGRMLDQSLLDIACSSPRRSGQQPKLPWHSC